MLEKLQNIVKQPISKSTLLQIGSAVLSALIVFTVVINTKIVTISDESGMISVMSVGGNAVQIIEKAGIELQENDTFETVRDEKGNIVEISIERGYNVPIYVDGTVHNINANGETVLNLLSQAGISLGAEDEVSPSLDRTVVNGTEIVIKRIETISRTEKKEIKPGTTYVYTSVLKTGRKLVRSSGVSGVAVDTYNDTYVNGVLSGSSLAGTKVSKEAVNKVVAVGKPGAAVSSMKFSDCPLDKNGIPVNYTKVWKGAKTTGYSVKPGQGTASGMKPVPGIVAVDTRDIPYGTRMYITSADGKYVYGYAIAGETGRAVRQGKVDLDLLYPTYEESCAHGVRYVNVYFLD